MANDEGLPSASSNEAGANLEKKSSLCPEIEVAAPAMSIQEPSSLSPESMNVPGQSAEAKSDVEDETTVIKLFGVVIKAKKPKKSETSSMMICGSSSTSTSRNGKEIESSKTVIDDESQYYSKKRKISVPGTIRKTLTRSDVDQSSRLLIGKQDMAAHVLPYFTEDQIAMARTVEGLPVQVWDVDNGGIYQLVLKQWKTGSFVLTGNWIPQFVQRKYLKVGDTIELVWHTLASMFLFRVSARSHGVDEASSSKAHSGGKEK